MELSGRIKEYTYNPFDKTHTLSLAINEGESLRAGLLDLNGKDLSISISKGKKKRSLDANGLLWACIGEIAHALTADKWDIYLKMLKRYGQFTYICVIPSAVEAIKKQWRECEEVGKVNINGRESVQLLCYYGSSTYNTNEFSKLLDGVISEMKEIGLQPPASEEMKQALEKMKERENK